MVADNRELRADDHPGITVQDDPTTGLGQLRYLDGSPAPGRRRRHRELDLAGPEGPPLRVAVAAVAAGVDAVDVFLGAVKVQGVPAAAALVQKRPGDPHRGRAPGDQPDVAAADINLERRAGVKGPDLVKGAVGVEDVQQHEQKGPQRHRGHDPQHLPEQRPASEVLGPAPGDRRGDRHRSYDCVHKLLPMMQQCGVGGVAVSDLSQHRPVLGRGGATVLTIVTGPAAAAAAAPAAASGEAGPAAVSETAALWSGFTTVATVSGSPTAFIGMPSGLRGDGGRGGGGHGSVRLGVAREPCIWSAQPRPAGGPTPL